MRVFCRLPCGKPVDKAKLSEVEKKPAVIVEQVEWLPKDSPKHALGIGKPENLVAAFNAHSPASHIVAQRILIVASADLPTVLLGFVDRGHLKRWTVLSAELWAAWGRDFIKGDAAKEAPPSNFHNVRLDRIEP